MKIKHAEYYASAVTEESLPYGDLPEFAFIGRSNVGKSSLINAIVGDDKLAFVSKKPGKTRTISLFNINKKWRLADLPGYGYASTGKAQRQKFGEMVMDYILNREALRCLMVLIDSKIPPQQIDLDFLQWLIGEGIPFVLVFTKVDRCSPTKLKRNVDLFLEAMKAFAEGEPMHFAVSAWKKTGIPELHQMVKQVLEKEKEKLKAEAAPMETEDDFDDEEDSD